MTPEEFFTDEFLKSLPDDVAMTIKRVRSGEDITVDERRKAVSALSFEGTLTQKQMAAFFKVSESSIRNDKQKEIQDRVEDLPIETDVKNVVAELIKNRDESVERIRKAQKQCAQGTYTWLAHERTINQIHLSVVNKLADLGWLPKNLGTLQIQKTIFKAVVAVDGSVSTRPALESDIPVAEVIESRPLDLYDHLQEGETLEQCIERRRRERQELIDAQMKQLPAASETTDGPTSEHPEAANQ